MLMLLAVLVAMAHGQDNGLSSLGSDGASPRMFVSNNNIKYSCPVGQRFVIFMQDANHIDIGCAPPNDGSQVTSCFQQSGSLCSGEGQYLSQIVEMPDGSGLMSTCCKFEKKNNGNGGRPARAASGESCSNHKVMPKELQDPNHPKKKDGKNPVVTIPAGHEVVTKLTESRTSGTPPPPDKQEAVKAMVPTPVGWSLIACKSEQKQPEDQQKPDTNKSPDGVIVGKCTDQPQCAAKCAEVSKSGDTKPRPTRQAASNLLSSKCDGGNCVCTFENIPDALKNLPKQGGGGGGWACFSGDSVVTTPAGPMRMDALKIGHQVMVYNEATGQTTFEPVDSFLHRRADLTTKFLDLHTAAGTRMSLTPGHMVPLVDCSTGGASSLTAAGKVITGQCVMVNQNGQVTPSEVIEIKEASKEGIYAPLTKSGNLVVDDTVGSCYSEFEGFGVQNSFYRIFNSLAHFWAHGSANVEPPTILHLFETINSV
jgi:hypothetical protein